jgi:hypothetical protein
MQFLVRFMNYSIEFKEPIPLRSTIDDHVLQINLLGHIYHVVTVFEIISSLKSYTPVCLPCYCRSNSTDYIDDNAEKDRWHI